MRTRGKRIDYAVSIPDFCLKARWILGYFRPYGNRQRRSQDVRNPLVINNLYFTTKHEQDIFASLA
jgi:hypothetical protein